MVLSKKHAEKHVRSNPKYGPQLLDFARFCVRGGYQEVENPSVTLKKHCISPVSKPGGSTWFPNGPPWLPQLNSTNSTSFQLYKFPYKCLETTIIRRCICAAAKPPGSRLGDPGVVSCRRISMAGWTGAWSSQRGTMRNRCPTRFG